MNVKYDLAREHFADTKAEIEEYQEGQPPRVRTDEEIANALRRMCDTVWNHERMTSPPFWCIPANPDTDVDCILYDAFRELRGLRAYVKALEDDLDRAHRDLERSQKASSGNATNATEVK